MKQKLMETMLKKGEKLGRLLSFVSRKRTEKLHENTTKKMQALNGNDVRHRQV